MTIKYSVLYPYYKRAGHLHNTFVSFLHHYSHRDDYEVIIAEDLKNCIDDSLHTELMNVLNKFQDRIKISRITITEETWNPCIAFNKAARAASGSFFIVSNPECFHQVNIFQGFDEEFEKDPSVYVVCGCRNKVGCNFFIENFDDLGGQDEVWYSHSVHRNACLHFCNALSKESWEKVEGFDEDYFSGIAYDDNDFINRVRRARLKILEKDDLLTIHIGHEPAHIDSAVRHRLEKVNWEVYHRKWD